MGHRLAVAMIVKNEESSLAECLESVRGIADEIVIGDTGSTDGTLGIAEQFGATVHTIQWEDDFAKARNSVLEVIDADWILQIDADEVLDPESAKRIRAIVDSDSPTHDGYWVTLANYTHQCHSWRWVAVEANTPLARDYPGYLAADIVRLFRHGLGIVYSDPVHETVGESLSSLGSSIGNEDLLIHHYGSDPDLPDAKTKDAFYLRLAQAKIESTPDNPKAWFDFATAAQGQEKKSTVLTAAWKAHRLAPDVPDYAHLLASLLVEDRAYEDARNVLQPFTISDPVPLYFLTALGSIETALGQFDKGAEYFQSVIDSRPDHVVSRLAYARTLDLLTRYQSAHDQLREAAQLAPRLEEARSRLEAHDLRKEGEVLFGQQDFTKALRKFVSALALDPEDPLLHNNIGVTLVALDDPQEAKASFQRSLLLAPHMKSARENLDSLA